jgi:hypothetical protein
MRNEEPTRTDPPPGFTGDLAADVGASLGWLWANSERRLEDPVEDRSGARRGHELAATTEGEPTTAALDHVELRRLCGRPC